MSIRKTQTGRKSLLTGASVLAAATAMFSVGGVTVAAAQEAEEDEAIVVTGTRIARRDAVAESPILTVGQEEMTNSGFVTVEQYLNTLPQVTAGISSQSNNPSSNGRAFIDLRGLGSARNLILLDGRRPIGSTAGGTVDVNTIPAALIERSELITGGAASTYGADAVAGVVNFILRDNFEGFAWDSQYRITERGDGEEWGTDFTFGGNFADGRGNAVFNASYFNRDVMYKNARDFAAQATNSTTIFPGGSWSAGAAAPTQAAVDALFGAGNCTANGGWAGFGFNPDGSLFCTGTAGSNTFNVFGFTGPSSYVATNFAPDIFSYNFEPDNILVLPLERWSFFSRVNLDVNDAFRPYIQAMFTNYNAKQELAATPAGGTTGWNVPTTNPFIPAAMSTLLGTRAAPAAPFSFAKRFSDLGGRTGENNHDVWQVTLGTEGDLTDTWSYDVYASYGRSVMTEIQGGNVRRDRVGLLLGDDTWYTAGTPGDAPSIAQQNTLSGGACPNGLNLFGNAPIDPTCAAWISLEAKNLTVLQQTIVEGTVTGDLFELPAGAVQVALGAGYRELDFDFKSDGGLQPGLVAGFNQQLPVSGVQDWFDIFGEIYIPILSNLPGVESLSITAGYRTSESSISGASESWKVNGDWTVTDWLRFRGGVQTAVRAPSITELFAPQLNNFPAFANTDPCDTNIAVTPGNSAWNRSGPNSAQITALCEAQSPAAALPGFTWPGQANAITGGNPNLDPETADSYTVGFVLNSPFSTGGFLDSLYLSVDYWSIEMENVIAAVGAATIVQRCFNRDNANPTYNPNNQWCQLFNRDQSNGSVIELELFTQNQAFQNTSGVDIAAGVGFDLGGMGSLDFNVISTWVERFETQTSTADPMNDYVGTIGTGTGSATPEWRHTVTTAWSMDAVTLTATARYIDAMVHSATVTGGSPVTNTGTDEVWYFDLRGTFDVTSNLTLRAGVNNVADEEPQLYSPNIQANTDPSTYDVLGRRFFVGFNLRM
ncbi:MAG TPA: TonB-dependent receptor [Terricaulis sp.]|nr:TonB-dependent receptor [Terricaulis sp.]